MTQLDIVRNPKTFELEQLPVIEYWTVCHEKDDIDEEGVPNSFYVNMYSFSPLNEEEIKSDLLTHNPNYILLDWGEIDPSLDEF